MSGVCVVSAWPEGNETWLALRWWGLMAHFYPAPLPQLGIAGPPPGAYLLWCAAVVSFPAQVQHPGGGRESLRGAEVWGLGN